MSKYLSSFVLIQLKSVKSGKIDGLLILLTMLTILFIPYIKINAELFLGLEELLIIFMGIRLLFVFWIQVDQILLLLGVLTLIILTSILTNPNFKDYREYLEIHKLAKFGVVYLFTIFYFKDYLNHKILVIWITLCFIGMLIFNILHLFNIFYFNEFITILYDTDGRDVLFFGKNSLGGPGPKRIIGTMGNPNINAILFLMFFSFFAFLKIEEKKNNSPWKIIGKKSLTVLLLLSMLFVVFCQSRTGIVALIFLYSMTAFMRKLIWKELLFEIICVIVFFGISAYVDTISLQYLSNTKARLEENNSLTVRIRIWGELLLSWTQSPIFGYGPNKSFMYRTKLHPENEYIFYLWRYGIQGLLGYLAIFAIPFFNLFKNMKDFAFLYLVIFILMIVALMNNPLANQKISILFAFVLGVSVALFLQNKNSEHFSLD